MAERPKAVYNPGELDRVRQRLGEINDDEAKRMASILGGEVGIERSEDPAQKERASRHREATVELQVKGKTPASQKKPGGKIDVLSDDDTRRRQKTIRKMGEPRLDPADDPSVPIKLSYRERVRMDRQASLPEFEIKTSAQSLLSLLSVFSDPPDFIAPSFTEKRMNEYYSRIESLVTATRALLPRSNIPRNESLRVNVPFAYLVLTIIRDWPIEKISTELAQLQSRPREVRSEDYLEILRCIYRPLYQLGLLDTEKHIREAYRLLYKELLKENAAEAKARHQGLIRTALSSYATISGSIQYLLYPLLLRHLSDSWLSYSAFLERRAHRLMHFLGLSEKDRVLVPSEEELDPSKRVAPPAETPAEKTPSPSTGLDGSAPPTGPKPPSKALLRGLVTLEQIFPEAGWNRLAEFPDLYPYFSAVFNLQKGYDLIPPNDPMHQIVILMLILEELFYGLRYISFSPLSGPDPELEKTDKAIERIITGWHGFVDEIFGKEYLPRLIEYCRILESPTESRTSNYAKKNFAELLWIKRLFFLPFTQFESVFTAAPFKRQEITPLYRDVRELRRVLTAVAAGIEDGNRAGGAEARANCAGIDNPWDEYVFQVGNPVSERIDSLLGGKGSRKRTNAALVFYTLSVVTVLDSLINEEGSWAYGDVSEFPFRSEDGQGIKPLFVTSEKVDVDAVFRKSLRTRGAGPRN